MNRFLLAAILVASTVITSKSQTQQENLNRTYWNLRSDYQKRFTVIGEGPGYSLPIASLSTSDYIGTECSPNNQLGLARFGDEPQLQGYYLAMLSTEYALLVQSGQNTSACLNEIYYALRAINRLDEQAEFYLSQNQSGINLNGFLCRDDVPATFMNEFTQNQYPITFDIRDLRYPCVESDGYDMQWECCYSFTGDVPGPFNKANYMSQDHVFNLLMGLAFVKRYVPNVFVKPTINDAGFYIVTEAQAIVGRMMSYITSLKTFNESGACLSFQSEVEVSATWSICNPYTLKREDPKSELHAFSYALAIAAQQINGIDYSLAPIIWNYTDDTWWNPLFLCRPEFVRNPSDMAYIWTTISSLPSYSYTVSYPLLSAYPTPASGITLLGFDQYSTTEHPMLRMNSYLTMLLGTISGVVPHHKITQMSDEFDKSQILDLVYSSLNSDYPSRSAAYYENMLLQLPCQGPFNYNSDPNSPVLAANESWPWNTTMFWSQAQAQGLHYDGSFGEYHGIDWMLLYNLYRLHYNLGYTAYSDNSCPCDGSNAHIDLNVDQNNNLVSTVVLSRKFPQYVEFDIKLKEYLTHDLHTLSGNNLTTNTDLIVCNNSTLEVQNGSTLAAHSSINDEASIVVRKGSVLILRTGATLEVQDRCKVVIEEGAKIIYEDGAQIQLLGDNAVLDIQGTLELGTNATFTFTHPNVNSGYVRFSRTTWVPWDQNALDYQIIAGSGSSMEFIGDNKNDKVLEIAQSSLWIPDALDHFKVYQAMVDFAGNNQNGSPFLSIGCPIVSLTFARFESAPLSNGGNGILLYGQPNHAIYNCSFEGLGAGITALNSFNVGILKISSSKFTNCGTGLEVYDKGVDLNACRFENCNTGAIFNGLTINSVIRNCKFNNNIHLGIEAKGSPIEIALTNCEAKNNGDAGISAAGVTMNLACCDLRNNGVYGMIIDYDASLRMSPVFNGGNNNLGNNQIPVIMNEASQVEIAGGRNKLGSFAINGNPNNQNLPDIFVGSIQTPCLPYVIDAKNNEWINNGTIYISDQWNNQPINDLPVSMNPVTAVGCINVPVRFSDLNQMSYQQCQSGPNGPPGGGGPPNNYSLTPLNNCSNCHTINTQSFPATQTDSAARTAIRKMDSTIVNGYSDAVGMFNELLLYPLQNETNGDQYVKKASSRKMHEALGEGIRHSQITYSSTVLSPEATKVIAVESYEKDKGDSTGDYHRKFFAAMREAEAYRASGKRDAALQKFNDILVWVQPAERPWTEYWQCLTHYELQALTGQIAKEQFREQVAACIPMNTIPSGLRLNDPSEESETAVVSSEINAKVFPNPAKEVLSIEVEQGQEESSVFELYSSTGQLVLTKSVNGSNQQQVELSGLSSGLYFYRIRGESDMIKEGKLVISD